MGLDTTHDAFHGGYAGFTIMREALLIAAGHRLDTEEYPPRCSWNGPPNVDDENPAENGDRAAWNRAELGDIDRDEWPWDPVLYLWAHQDCDGIIKPAMAAAIADRLTELLPKIEEATKAFAPAWTMEARPADGRNTTALVERFAKGCRAAADAGENVEFH